jgi:hypothetical protein
MEGKGIGAGQYIIQRPRPNNEKIPAPGRGELRLG